MRVPRWVVVILWIFIWIPVSLLFPMAEPHMPIPAACEPVWAPLMVTATSGRDRWVLVVLPAVIFWGGLWLLLLLRRRLFDGPPPPPARG